MAEHRLTLEVLCKLDMGKVAHAVDHELKQVVRDIIDRPGDKAKRKVVLMIEATPTLDKDTAQLDTIGVRFKVKSSTPERQSMEYPMLPTNSGGLLFQELSPMDPRQTELPYERRIQTPPMTAVDADDVDKETGEVRDS